MKMIAIIAGGIPPHELTKADFIIGVDRGALWLVKHGITPDMAIGDFDSVTEAEKARIRKRAKIFLEYPRKKNVTDLELAIDEAIKLHPKSVTIYGALGSRFDHSLAAVQMLLNLESYNISGQIVDNYNKINIVRRKITIIKDPAFRYVSIIPYGLPATVTLKGFVYDISKKILKIDSSLGISNEIRTKFATILVHQGLVILVQSRD